MKLIATGIDLAWQGRQLFHGLDIRLAEREIVALVGRSGCGKTSLLQLLACLQRPDRGEIVVDGAARTRPGHACYLPQQDSLMPWLRLTDNLLLPLRLGGKSMEKQKFATLLRRFGLAQSERLYPHQLSGGMRQRAALLRAWLSGTEVLLLDEPLGALDAITRSEMQHWLAQQLWKMGNSAVLVSHDIEEALLLGDRIVVMRDQPAQLQAIANPLGREQRFAEEARPLRATWRGKIAKILEQA